MIIDGNKLKNEIAEELKQRITSLGFSPELAIVYVGNHPVIEKYISIKKKFAEQIGVRVAVHSFDEMTSTEMLREALRHIIAKADGVIIQLPLPGHIDREAVLNAVPKEKDVDVLSRDALTDFHSTMRIYPPVVGAIRHVITRFVPDFRAKRIVIVGKGKLVGKPTIAWLTHENVKYVSVGKEDDLKAALDDKDLIISGVGNPSMILPEMIKKGAVLIDAGTSEEEGVIKGDMDPRCADVASLFTPVPGGIGPLTVAMLYSNLVTLCEKRK